MRPEYDVSKGRILVDGVDIRDVTLSSLRKNVGTAQQDIFLFYPGLKMQIGIGNLLEEFQVILE